MVDVRYYDELLRFFVNAVRDAHEAQDLAQQTMARMLERGYQAQQVGNERALMFEVARNLLIDRFRQQQLRRHEGDEALRDHPAPPSADPEAVYAGHQRLRLMIAAIEGLPARCRQAFMLHKIEGLPQAEVALQMGISLNMVERHIMLAVATCRKALGDAPAAATARRPAREATLGPDSRKSAP